MISRREFLSAGIGATAFGCVFSPTPPTPWAGDDVYVCPPCGLKCDELKFNKPGSCPTCGMKLIRPGPVTIESLMEGYRIPGLSIAIIDDFKVTTTRAYGVTEAGGTRPVTPNTLFLAGSVSKPVAAVAALHLVELGKLSLDEDVNLKLKSWKVPESEYTRDQKVTLRRIMSHSSGTTVHGYAGYQVGQPIPTLTQVLDGVKPANSPPVRVDFVPGARWRYSGGGVLIEQQLMMDVTGDPFPQIMHETVFKKVGMKNSTFEQPLPASLSAEVASGTLADGSVVPGRWHVYPEMSAAGLWTTPTDLAKLAVEVAMAKRGRSNRVLSQGMASEMLKPQMPRVEEISLGDLEHRDRMGLGFFLGDETRPDLFGHIGDDAGFQAMLMMFAASGKGAVVMANSEFGITLGDFVLDSIAKEFGWQKYVSSFRPHAHVT